MKILFAELPKHDWWGKGMPVYEDNWIMINGTIPNQETTRQEHLKCLNTLRDYSEVLLIPFPDELDSNNKYKHDFVFQRDMFISNQKGDIVICNFSANGRQPEADYMRKYLKKIGLKTHNLSSSSHLEGGECHYLSRRNLLFAGIHRNNHSGIKEITKILGISKVFIVKANSYHLDTVFTVLLDSNNDLAGVLTCPNQIDNKNELITFLAKNEILLIELDEIDTIGTKEKIGNFATNSLALPGVLIGGARFQTEGVEDRINSLGIKHIITPTSQFNLSAGSVHCLTNEL